MTGGGSVTDEHRCLAARHCRAVTVEDGHKVPAYTEAAQSLCVDCVRGVGWAVSGMDAMWLALHMAIGDQTRRPGQKVSGSPAAPINLNTDVDALKMSIVEWLVAAAARVAETLNTEDPQPRNSTDSEQYRVAVACTRLLAVNVDRLVSLPPGDVLVWLSGDETPFPGERFHVDEHGVPHIGVKVAEMSGVDLAMRLTELRNKARTLLALTNPVERLPLPCPGCNTYELVRTHHITYSSDQPKDFDEIDCTACGLNWPYERYQHLCLIWVKEDEVEREKLAEQLETEKQRRQLAEWCLAKREWQFSLALACTDMAASEFAKTVLAEPPPEDCDGYMSDRDVAALVGVSDSTVRSWASRGVITRHTGEDGSTLFLAGEVWEYAKANAGGRTVRRLSNERKAAVG